jgi:hypothetical protein
MSGEDKSLRDRIADAIPVVSTLSPHVGAGDARRLRIADAVLPVVLAHLAALRQECDDVQAEAKAWRAMWHEIRLAGGNPQKVIKDELWARLDEVMLPVDSIHELVLSATTLGDWLGDRVFAALFEAGCLAAPTPDSALPLPPVERGSAHDPPPGLS